MRKRGYRDLDVWRKGIDLCEEVYAACKSLPDDEKYGLISQMRRSAISVPANIAEGYGRNSKKEFTYFLRVATGSLHELETHIILAERFRYLGRDETTELLDAAEEIGKMLFGLIRSQQTA